MPSSDTGLVCGCSASMRHPTASARSAFTLIELLVVIAIIAILAVVVVLTLNPAQLLAQSRDANRVSDMATIQSALSMYSADQAGGSSFYLGKNTETYLSVPDPSLSGNQTSTCGPLGMLSLGTGTWRCASPADYRTPTSTGWIPVALSRISAGSPLGSLPVDPVNQTSSGLFYSYATNGSQFEVTANLESSKYKQQYGNNPQTAMFPEVISAGTPNISSLYNANGLVGYWPLNEGTGTTAIDQSGNGNAGTWYGTPLGNASTYYTGGKVGSSAGYLGGNTSGDYIRIGGGLPTRSFTSISIAAWILQTSNAIQSPEGIVSLETSAWCTNPAYVLSANISSKVGFYSSAAVVASPNLPLGTWHFVVGTYNAAASTTALYVDGVLSGQQTGAVAPSYTARSAEIGAYKLCSVNGSSSGSLFNGSIDDVRIYDNALSAAQVAALYNAEK